MLFVSVATLEAKVKPRKGQSFKWQPMGAEIRETILAHSTDTIAHIEQLLPWKEMAGTHHHPQATQRCTAASNTEATTSSVATSETLHER